jgi:hypothetical protein
MIYTGLGGAGFVALFVVLADSLRYFRKEPGVDHTSTVPVFGMFHAPLGFIILGYGTLVDLAAAPLDNYWHELYGIDVTLWAPFHITGTIGGLLAGLGILYIFASEAAIERERRSITSSGHRFLTLSAPEWGALIFFAAFLELTFPPLTVFPLFTLGSWQVVTYPLPLACATGFGLIGSLQFTRRPGTATLVVLLLWIMALITQLFVPWALHVAASYFGLSFRPSAGEPAFNVTLAILPALFLIDAVIVDGVAFWQRRRNPGRDEPLRWSGLLGALMALPFVFLPSLLVIGLVHIHGIPLPKDIIRTFLVEPTVRNILLTTPLALLMGGGGALCGLVLGDIWYWSKR